MLIRRLPHPVNAYTDSFMNGVLTRVNGRHIRRLEDVQAAWQSPSGGFHVMEFAGMDEELVMQDRQAHTAHADILNAYGIPSDTYLGEDVE